MKTNFGSSVAVCAAAAALFTLSACSEAASDARAESPADQAVQESAPPATVKANVVTVTARDYAFEAPDEIPAGWTRFEMLNEGPDFHHIWLVRLDEGKTLDDVLAFIQSESGPPPAWAVDVGGPNAPLPGETATATLELIPGRYAMLCVIPAMADGMPHMMKGMMKEIMVVPADAETTAAPEANIVMTLSDYDFQFSEPLTAGEHTIRIDNVAEQPHEVLLVQLAPGKTVAEMLAFIEKPEGTPPGKPIGGITGIATGRTNYIDVSLEPGDYGLLCFVPDAGDGQPHFAHGMMKQITVE